MATNSMPELEGSVSAQPATLGDSFYAQLRQARTETTNNSKYLSEETRKSISDKIRVRIPRPCLRGGQYQFFSISGSSLLHMRAVHANLIVPSVVVSGMVHEI
jgi:hypothetical protein